jgi:hypothetical protein
VHDDSMPSLATYVNKRRTFGKKWAKDKNPPQTQAARRNRQPLPIPALDELYLAVDFSRVFSAQGS